MKPRVEVSKKLLFINSISGIITRILNVTIIVWMQQYLLKRISTEEYSLYPVTMSIMIFIFMMRIILTGGISRYVTEAYARGDERGVTQITSTMFIVQLCGAIIILSSGFLFSWHIDKILTIKPDLVWDARIMMGLMVISFIIQLSGAPFVVGLFVKQKFVLMNIIRFGANLLRILLLFVLLLGVSTRVLWVVVASEAANLTGMFFQIVLSRRFIPSIRFSYGEINWKIAKKLFSFQFWTFITHVSYRIQTSADPIILNKLATSFDVTCFYLGSLFKKQIDNAMIVLTQPIIPGLTAMHAMGEKSRLANTYLRYGRYYTWLFMMIALPLIIYRKELIILYVGFQYLLAAKVLVLLLCGVFLVAGNALMHNIAVAKGQMKELAIRGIIIQLLNLSLTLYLVGVLKMGALGSALGSFSVYVFIGPFLSIPIGLRLANVSFGKWLKSTVLPGYLPGIIAFAVWFVLKLINKPETWFILILYSFIGCMSYLAILILFCLQKDDVKDIQKILIKLKNVFLKLNNKRV